MVRNLSYRVFSLKLCLFTINCPNCHLSTAKICVQLAAIVWPFFAFWIYSEETNYSRTPCNLTMNVKTEFSNFEISLPKSFHLHYGLVSLQCNTHKLWYLYINNSITTEYFNWKYGKFSKVESTNYIYTKAQIKNTMK